LHPNISFDRRDPDELARVIAAGEEILRACVEAGGVSAETQHGLRSAIMCLMFSEADLDRCAGCDASILTTAAIPADPRAAGVCGEQSAPPWLRARELLAVGDGFEAIVGVAHVERPAALRLASARVAAIVRPGNARELAACLRAASEAALAIVACGGATRQHLGNPLDAVECVRLELGRIREHVDVDADEGIATLDAGVRVGELARRLAACGKTSPLAQLAAEGTVGGALAADPFAPDWTLDRRLPNEVLGIEIALANGELTTVGGRVVKNVTGFDLVRLYCGSLGTLGVITRATVRLRAAPECERVVRARFPSLQEGIEAFARAALSTEPAAAALRPDGAGAELLCRLSGDAKAVELQARGSQGDRVARLWTRSGRRSRRRRGPARVRSRHAERRAALCRAAAAGPGGALQWCLPARRSVVAR
jgi:glycolate oxidase FAD binding subunit